MAGKNEVRLAGTLIAIGAGLSGLMIGGSGGQSVFRFIGMIAFLVGVNGVVALIIARLIRDIWLAIFGSIITTVLLFTLLVAWPIGYRTVGNDAMEMGLIIIIGMAIYTLPIAVAGSIGFVLLGSRWFWRQRPRADNREKQDEATKAKMTE